MLKVYDSGNLFIQDKEPGSYNPIPKAGFNVEFSHRFCVTQSYWAQKSVERGTFPRLWNLSQNLKGRIEWKLNFLTAVIAEISAEIMT